MSNSGIKEDVEAKILAVKVKDCVDELSVTSPSTTKIIRDLRATVAAAKKAE